MLEQLDDKGKPNFHRIAFEEYVMAMLEGKHNDSDYVKKMAYDRYEKLLRKNEL
jgi:hypothetical protein